MGENQQYAYIREYESSHQYHLTFDLSLDIFNTPKLHGSKSIITTISNSATIRELLEKTESTVLKVVEEQLKDQDIARLLKENCLKFTKHNKEVKDTSPIRNHIQFVKSDMRLCCYGIEYIVRFNAPLFKTIELPLTALVNYNIAPIKFYAMFIDKKASHYFWYRSKDKITWERISKKYQYLVKKDDIGYYLKFVCVPFNQFNTAGPPVEVICINVVDTVMNMPDDLTEYMNKRHSYTPIKLNGKEFRVVSYNILADRYADPIQFSYCTPGALCIHYRKQLIIKELNGYNADIICLQEVDEFHYKSYFEQEFKQVGYNSIYNRKGNRIPEGLVCVYNTLRYKKLETKHIVLSVDVISRKIFSNVLNILNNNVTLWERFRRQNTSLQVTVLQSQNNKKQITIVGNTHLYYHPEANDVRLLQANMASIFLNFVKQKYLQETEDVHVVFCGDFNSSPEKSLYPFLTTGILDMQHPDYEQIVLSPEPKKICSNLVFKSASGTPKYTNYTSDYKGCLDYIFIESDKTHVKAVIPLPTEDDLVKFEGLPNEYFPSDHMPLVVDLQYK